MPDVTNLQTRHLSRVLDEEVTSDVLYSARVNDLEDLKRCLSELSQQHGMTPVEVLQHASDPHTGNTVAHFAAANGHVSILNYFQELESDERLAVNGSAGGGESIAHGLFSHVNHQGSTALHYAAVNGQLQTVEMLLSNPSWEDDKMRRRAYVAMRNTAGRTARDEAESQSGGREGWLKVAGLLERQEIESTEDLSVSNSEDLDVAVEKEIDITREAVEGMNTD